MSAPWYVVITRQTLDYEPLEDVVIGPFPTEEEARDHGQDSADVQDWCYGEAKAQRYYVDDVFWTQQPEIPSYGVNAPVYTEGE